MRVFAQGLDISRNLLRYIYKKKSVATQVTKDWITIRISEFTELLNSIEEFVVKEDILSELSRNIEDNVNMFIDNVQNVFEKNQKLRKKVTEVLYRILFSPSKSEKEEIITPEVPEAVLLAHSYVSLLMASILYESVAPQHAL